MFSFLLWISFVFSIVERGKHHDWVGRCMGGNMMPCPHRPSHADTQTRWQCWELDIWLHVSSRAASGHMEFTFEKQETFIHPLNCCNWVRKIVSQLISGITEWLFIFTVVLHPSTLGLVQHRVFYSIICTVWTRTQRVYIKPGFSEGENTLQSYLMYIWSTGAGRLPAGQ